MDLPSIKIFVQQLNEKNVTNFVSGRKEEKQQNKVMDRGREIEWENRTKEEIYNEKQHRKRDERQKQKCYSKFIFGPLSQEIYDEVKHINNKIKAVG